MPELLKIANKCGNVQCPPPKGYVHIRGQRLQPLCQKLGIKFAQALVGWGGTRRYPKPLFDGLVVAVKSADKLRVALASRKVRNAMTPYQRMKKREAARSARQRREDRRQEEAKLVLLEMFPSCPDHEAEAIVRHAFEVGSGRVGRTSMWGLEEKLRMAIVAHVRHCHTDYEELIEERFHDREVARLEVADQVTGILAEWERPQNVKTPTV